MHAIGEALERPVANPNAPAFPREVIRLFAGGRRMEVRLVAGTRYELGSWTIAVEVATPSRLRISSTPVLCCIRRAMYGAGPRATRRSTSRT